MIKGGRVVTYKCVGAKRSKISKFDLPQTKILWYRISINYSFFFLRCQNYTDLRKCLMNELIKTDSCILTLDKKSFTKLLLYGGGRYDSKTNKSIILSYIHFIYSSERFDGQLL